MFRFGKRARPNNGKKCFKENMFGNFLWCFALNFHDFWQRPVPRCHKVSIKFTTP